MLALAGVGVWGCGPGPMTRALGEDVARLKAQIGETEAAISEARRESDALESELATAIVAVSEKLAGRLGGTDHLYLELPSALVAELAEELLDGYEGREEGGSGPPAVWTLRGLHTRPHRGRIFISGSYDVKVGGGQCQGPLNGHLFYLQGNLLKLAEVEIHCKASGHKVAVDVAERVPAIPVPFEVRSTIPLQIKAGVTAPAKTLRVVTPVQLELGVERTGVRSRATTVRRDES